MAEKPSADAGGWSTWRWAELPIRAVTAVPVPAMTGGAM
jgi:hypothetical protein